MKKLKLNNNKNIALAQIFILVIGIIAMTWMVGGEFGVVSAEKTECEKSGYVCAPSCTDLFGGEWESVIGVCEMGSGEICCKPKAYLNTQPDVSYTGEVSTSSSGDEGGNSCGVGGQCWDECGTYNESIIGQCEGALKCCREMPEINSGDELTNQDTGETYKAEKDDFNKDGSIKAGGKLATWLESLGMGYVGNKVTGVTDDLFKSIFKKGGEEVGKGIFKGWFKSDFFKNFFEGGQGGLGTFVVLFVEAIVLTGLTYLIASNIMSTSNAEAVTIWVGAGTGATLAAVTIAGLGLGPGALLVLGAALVGWAGHMLISHELYSQDVMTLQCGAWQPQAGGEDCELCHETGTCTEYKCKSLGQACKFVNSEYPGQERCFWENPNDIDPPTITPMEDILLDDYSYSPIQYGPSPLEKGVEIKYKGGCLPPYKDLLIGVETNEIAKCMLDVERPANFSEMLGFMSGNGANVEEHTLFIPGTAIPRPSDLATIEGLSAESGKENEFYIRCQDANGNENPVDYLIRYCVDDAPDGTAPEIISTTIPSGTYVQSGIDSIETNVYTDEPATCKWNHIDIEYESMENEMNDCPTDASDLNGISYSCLANLTGLKDREETSFYIRCKDFNGNANSEGKLLLLKGSQPLLIDSIEPNNTIIKDSRTDDIPVEINVKTFAGADNGKAVCEYSETGIEGSYIRFSYDYGVEEFATNTHKQDFWLAPATYNLWIKCYDQGGNTANDTISFKVETDTIPPAVVRAYYESNHLKIITNEDCEKCVYNTNKNLGCNYDFDDGTEMSSIDELAYYTDWASNTNYYIKCKDKFTNYPLPNACTIIVNTFESY